MRNIATIILICFLSFPAFGQETESSHKDKTYKSIYLELLGASNMIGVSYDTRIKPGSAFGYRAGISYFYGTNYNSNKGGCPKSRIAPFAIVYFGKNQYLTVATNKHYSNG